MASKKYHPQLEFFNTLTSSKQLFSPLKSGEVGLYVCGITPYDDTHLGHGRCYVVFDILKRVLERHGYKVTHIQNFTDIDDKIIERAKKAQVHPGIYAEPFIKNFHEWMKRLNVKSADRYPRVTEHIAAILELIERLLIKNLAYEIDGSIYFSVRKFPSYGILSKRKIDELELGARVEVNERKNDPLDFALWKSSPADEPGWTSPWGWGRPGWHIECSAMSMMYLGEEFDIHGGGQDLIFPHHENEMAQSVGATNQPFARTWIHNGFVTVDQQKMSKSLGNFFTLKDILAQFDPMVIRYFLLTQHYKSPLNFSDQELKVAETTWVKRITAAYKISKSWVDQPKSAPTNGVLMDVDENPVFQEFFGALSNDLSTPQALGVLNQFCSLIFEEDTSQVAPTENRGNQRALYHRVLHEMFELLGLLPPQMESWDSRVLEMVSLREQARKGKNWAESDRLRKEIASLGVVVEDTISGPRLKKN